MKADVLVDTSAWIQYFNKRESSYGDAVERLLREGRVVTAGIILTELLQGARIKREFDSILEGLGALPFLEPDYDTWILAGKISYSLRKKGITLPTTDLLIAALAMENHCSIITLDQHFKQIPEVELYDVT